MVGRSESGRDRKKRGGRKKEKKRRSMSCACMRCVSEENRRKEGHDEVKKGSPVGC